MKIIQKIKKEKRPMQAYKGVYLLQKLDDTVRVSYTNGFILCITSFVKNLINSTDKQTLSYFGDLYAPIKDFINGEDTRRCIDVHSHLIVQCDRYPDDRFEPLIKIKTGYIQINNNALLVPNYIAKQCDEDICFDFDSVYTKAIRDVIEKETDVVYYLTEQDNLVVQSQQHGFYNTVLIVKLNTPKK